MLAAREDDGVTPATARGKSGLLRTAMATSGAAAAALDPLLQRSATALAAAIRSGETTSLALTRLCLARVAAANPHLNAVVAHRAEAALAEAAAADVALATGAAPPEATAGGSLWGVPVLVKECFEVAGCPFTAGVASRKGCVGLRDADAVANLKAAGLVIVGLTNTSEACMWFESDNPLYGRSNNPFDLGRTPGGSSGGCASAVAARMAPLAVTSDVGGSTRIPAGYCGLFGLKPTAGTVSNAGTFPSCGAGEVNGYCQLGPTACFAEDLYPLLKVLAATRAAAPSSSSTPSGSGGGVGLLAAPGALQDPGSVDVGSLQVFVLGRPLHARLLSSAQHPDLTRCVNRAAEALEALG